MEVVCGSPQGISASALPSGASESSTRTSVPLKVQAVLPQRSESQMLSTDAERSSGTRVQPVSNTQPRGTESSGIWLRRNYRNMTEDATFDICVMRTC